MRILNEVAQFPLCPESYCPRVATTTRRLALPGWLSLPHLVPQREDQSGWQPRRVLTHDTGVKACGNLKYVWLQVQRRNKTKTTKTVSSWLVLWRIKQIPSPGGAFPVSTTPTGYNGTGRLPFLASKMRRLKRYCWFDLEPCHYRVYFV